MSKEVAIKETNTQAAVYESRFTPDQIEASQLDKAQSIPDLAEVPKHFMPLNIEYWAAKDEGEEKLVFIAGVNFHDVPDLETGEIKSLECVLMLEKQDNSLMRYINASKVLVGTIKDAINRGDIVPMTTLTPVAIKYLGQKKNRSNAKLSSRWQVSPLLMNN